MYYVETLKQLCTSVFSDPQLNSNFGQYSKADNIHRLPTTLARGEYCQRQLTILTCPTLFLLENVQHIRKETVWSCKLPSHNFNSSPLMASPVPHRPQPQEKGTKLPLGLKCNTRNTSNFWGGARSG